MFKIIIGVLFICTIAFISNLIILRKGLQNEDAIKKQKAASSLIITRQVMFLDIICLILYFIFSYIN
jgi:hypothetical protein